jgi:hypothetical protein
VICPHCRRNLLYKQRGRRRCALCRKEFALEPKSNKLGLHDVRVRTLAAKLSDDGRLRFTLTQLWYAASRKKLAESGKALNGLGCLLVPVGIFGAVVATVVASIETSAMGGVALGVAAVLVLAYLLLVVFRARWRRVGAIRMPMPLGELRVLVLNRYAEVHRGLPDGLVDETAATPPVIGHPRVALVCPDLSVLACLDANGAAQNFSMVLTTTPAQVPPGVPVVVVHDAGAAGARFAAGVRAALPGRTVVDAGLRPRVVRGKKNMVLLRHKPLPPGELMGLPLTPAEVRWVGAGWWSPVAAVRPAALLDAVGKAVLRAQEHADPERRRARGVGFLTWPSS